MLNRPIFCLTRFSATLAFIICAILPARAQDLPEFQKVPITLKASAVVPKDWS